MLDNTDGMHCNPIPVMLHEHDQGRNFVSSMVKGLEGNILYPMAEETLSEEDKERVLQLYDEVGAGQNSHAGLLQYFGL